MNLMSPHCATWRPACPVTTPRTVINAEVNKQLLLVLKIFYHLLNVLLSFSCFHHSLSLRSFSQQRQWLGGWWGDYKLSQTWPQTTTLCLWGASEMWWCHTPAVKTCEAAVLWVLMRMLALNTGQQANVQKEQAACVACDHSPPPHWTLYKQLHDTQWSSLTLFTRYKDVIKTLTLTEYKPSNIPSSN